MKKILVFSLLLCCMNGLYAQDIAVMFKEAYNLELKLKEPEALNKYKEILAIEPNNIKALVKATEFATMIGEKKTTKPEKKTWYDAAFVYASKAVAADSNNADAYYALALAHGKMTEVETENKKTVAHVREVKLNADKALAINANHAMAIFIEGKWHYEMISLNWAKRLAAKALYGGLPDASLDKAIEYFEKCKALEPYFVQNYYMLAKAYQEDNKATKQIETLKALVKLPVRLAGDIALKEEANKMLQDQQ